MHFEQVVSRLLTLCIFRDKSSCSFCVAFLLFLDWRQSLHSGVPTQSVGTSQRTKKLHEPKTGKFHQSQQPSIGGAKIGIPL